MKNKYSSNSFSRCDCHGVQNVLLDMVSHTQIKSPQTGRSITHSIMWISGISGSSWSVDGRRLVFLLSPFSLLIVNYLRSGMFIFLGGILLSCYSATYNPFCGPYWWQHTGPCTSALKQISWKYGGYGNMQVNCTVELNYSSASKTFSFSFCLSFTTFCNLPQNLLTPFNFGLLDNYKYCCALIGLNPMRDEAKNEVETEQLNSLFYSCKFVSFVLYSCITLHLHLYSKLIFSGLFWSLPEPGRFEFIKERCWGCCFFCFFVFITISHTHLFTWKLCCNLFFV